MDWTWQDPILNAAKIKALTHSHALKISRKFPANAFGMSVMIQ